MLHQQPTAYACSFAVDDKDELEDTKVEAELFGPASSCIPLSTMPIEPVVWRSRGWLAEGKVHVLDGDPGISKSTLLCDWTARMSTGRALPEGDPYPAAAVILLCEDSYQDVVIPRLVAAGADLDLVVKPRDLPNGGRYLLPRDVDRIERAVEETEAKLLAFDPWIAYFDPNLSPNSAHDVRQALGPVVEMAERTGVAVVFSRHLNKSSDGPALYRGSGSIGIAGLARFVHLVSKHPQNPDLRVLARVKGNLGAQPSSLLYELQPVSDLEVARVVYRGHTTVTADELVSAQVPSRRGKLDEAKDLVQEVLAEGLIPSSQLEEQARQAGISPATLRRAKEELGIISQKETGAQGQWLVSLPGNDAQEDLILHQEDAQMDPDFVF
jgi:hypothetical protein